MMTHENTAPPPSLRQRAIEAGLQVARELKDEQLTAVVGQKVWLDVAKYLRSGEQTRKEIRFWSRTLEKLGFHNLEYFLYFTNQTKLLAPQRLDRNRVRKEVGWYFNDIGKTAPRIRFITSWDKARELASADRTEAFKLTPPLGEPESQEEAERRRFISDLARQVAHSTIDHTGVAPENLVVHRLATRDYIALVKQTAGWIDKGAGRADGIAPGQHLVIAFLRGLWPMGMVDNEFVIFSPKA